uniref:Uncharacterized protein n=1 Tax=Amphimedon queenslandica TaxID=400682 RepID=A0A1X7T6V4_AMPQE
MMKAIDEIKSTSEYETDGSGSSLMLGITEVLMPTIQLCRVFLEGLNVTEVAHDNSPPVTSYIVEELKLKKLMAWTKNVAKAMTSVEARAKKRAGITWYPELSVSGYILDGVFQASSTHLSPKKDSFWYYNLQNDNQYSSYGLSKTGIY